MVTHPMFSIRDAGLQPFAVTCDGSGSGPGWELLPCQVGHAGINRGRRTLRHEAVASLAGHLGVQTGSCDSEQGWAPEVQVWFQGCRS